MFYNIFNLKQHVSKNNFDSNVNKDIFEMFLKLYIKNYNLQTQVYLINIFMKLQTH